MKFFPFLFMILFSFSDSTKMETITFEVVMRNKIVGELIASKEQKKELTIFKSKTQIKTQLLKEINVLYDYTATFSKKKMIHSTADINVNGKAHEKTLTKWNDKNYDITFLKKKKKSVGESIVYSSLKLLFDEPNQVRQSFSEKDGEFHKLELFENNIYKKTNSKGRVNKYFYKDGQLEKAEVNAGIIKFQLIRK